MKRATRGWIWKRRNAERKIVAAKRGIEPLRYRAPARLAVVDSWRGPGGSLSRGARRRKPA